MLELCCGIGGWSKGFAELGYECTGIDIKKLGYPYRFIKADIFDWEPDQDYSVVCASPLCSPFSHVNQNFNGKNNESKGLNLVWRVFDLINKIKPDYYVVENVKGLAGFLPPPNDIVRYAKKAVYKEAYLWHNFPKVGMLETMIDRRTTRADFELADRRLFAEIPLPLSRQFAKSISKTDVVK